MAGRPTEKSDEIIRKIEECAALGSSIEEIAFYAGIHRATLYRWMAEDQELKDRIEELQERPILKARQTVVKSLEEPENAKWYLERKRKNEFSTRTETDNTNKTDISGGVQITNIEEITDNVLTQLKDKKFNGQKAIDKTNGGEEHTDLAGQQ